MDGERAAPGDLEGRSRRRPSCLRGRCDGGFHVIDQPVGPPNVNEGFDGGAPDLGALEAGQQIRIYGPAAIGLGSRQPVSR